MESKKAKFSVFLVVALLAIICSSSLYSVTGGFSDWIVASTVNEDQNNNGIIDSAENDNSIDYSNSYNGEESSNNEGGGLFGFFSNSQDSFDSNSYDSYSSYSSSSQEPDLLARLLRGFLNSGNSVSTSYQESNGYDNYNVPVSDYDFSSLSGSDYGDGSDYSSIIDRGVNKVSGKINSLFY